MPTTLNPDNLRVARSERKLDFDEVAQFTDISARRLEMFESGDVAPTFRQLEKLGQLYNVPLYAFYSELRPNIESVPPDFRKRTPVSADLSPRGLVRIWQVEKVAEFTHQLVLALGESAPSRPDNRKRFELTDDLAFALRAEFDDWLGRRRSKLKMTGSLSEATFKYLRLFIESRGALTSYNDAPEEDYLGFYKEFVRGTKSIFVNRAVANDKAQLFTLAHELAHFISGTEGISNPFVSTNRTEKQSNRFAAAFLAPDPLILSIVGQAAKADRADPQTLIRLVSSQSLLGFQAAAIRLRELQILQPHQVRPVFRSFKMGSYLPQGVEKPKKRQKGGGRGAAVGRKVSETGIFAIYVASLAIAKKIIDPVDVERGLNISENLQPDVFSMAAKRFEASID